MDWRGELRVIAVEDMVLCPGGQATTLLFPQDLPGLDALVAGPVLFVARRPGSAARRGRGSLYRVGTIAELTMTRFPDGMIELNAFGLARAAVESFRGRDPFMVATCRTLPEPSSLSDEEFAVTRELGVLLDRIALFGPGALSILEAMPPTERAWAAVDLVAGGLIEAVEDRQRLLETNDRLERLVRARDFARAFDAWSSRRTAGSPSGYLH